MHKPFHRGCCRERPTGRRENAYRKALCCPVGIVSVISTRKVSRLKCLDACLITSLERFARPIRMGIGDDQRRTDAAKEIRNAACDFTQSTDSGHLV